MTEINLNMSVSIPDEVYEKFLTELGRDEQGTPIDREIAALVGEMNRVGIHTTCSCQGHVGQDGAYISIKVGEGTTYDYRDDTKELTLRWRRQG